MQFVETVDFADARVEDLAAFLADLDWFEDSGEEEMHTAQEFWREFDRQGDNRTETLERLLQNLFYPVYGEVTGDDYVQEFLSDWLGWSAE